MWETAFNTPWDLSFAPQPLLPLGEKNAALAMQHPKVQTDVQVLLDRYTLRDGQSALSASVWRRGRDLPIRSRPSATLQTRDIKRRRSVEAGQPVRAE
jgi:hypothetical protein